jgi:ATP-dependent DNA ligase
MRLPVEPPVAPMLARLTREIPVGSFAYEPKWDGFRCLAFRDGDEVDLRSRHDRPLARYFPEVVTALRGLAAPRFALDGEIILVLRTGFDFGALMSRLHPAASRVERLAADAPASFVAFDILAVGDEDLRDRAFTERRGRLEALVASADAAGPVRITPLTRDATVATEWLAQFHGGGLDGVVAKPLDARYEAGRRTMFKVKSSRTADCVLAGVRLLPDGSVSSLLLGLYDDAGTLRHVGVVTQLPRAERRALADELRRDVIPIDRHPWREGFAIGRSPLGRLLGSASRWTPEMGLDWVPLDPQRVVEVAFDQVDGDRLRHPARLVRWRPDRDAESCSLDQILVKPEPSTNRILSASAGQRPGA